MICAECKKAGQKSKVRSGWSETTLTSGDSYWDEEGTWHDHDPNVTTTEYRCSNGHAWTEKTRKKCPGCAAHCIREIFEEPKGV